MSSVVNVLHSVRGVPITPEPLVEQAPTFADTSCLISIPSTCLLAFEYVITFDREYQLVWKRRFSAATLVFLFARYVVLLEDLLSVSALFPLTDQGCSALGWLIDVLSLFNPLFWAVFLSLRAYALSGRQWRVASLILILSLIPFGIDIFHYVHATPKEVPPPLNCETLRTGLLSVRVNEISILVSRSATICADILVLAVTVSKTYNIRRLFREADFALHTSFGYLLLRDGTIYFVVLLIMNLLSIISSSTQGFLYFDSFFVDSMTAILVSRFILNLREVESSGNIGPDASRASATGSVRFASFVDPLSMALGHEYPSSASSSPDIARISR